MLASLGALLFSVALFSAVATIVMMSRSYGRRMIAALMMDDRAMIAPVRTTVTARPRPVRAISFEMTQIGRAHV